MANSTMFGPDCAGVVGTTPSFVVIKELTAATATPEVIFNANNVVPRSFRVIDFKAYNDTGGAQALATAQLETNLNGGGLAAVSDALAIALNDGIARATTINPAQRDLTFGNAVEDVMDVAKNANGDGGLVWVHCILR